jgi:hypothetical protein
LHEPPAGSTIWVAGTFDAGFILRATRLLGDRPVHFKIIGTGQEPTVPAREREDLATALRALAEDLPGTEAIAAAGHRRFQRDDRGEKLSAEPLAYLNEALELHRGRDGLG